MLLTFSTKNYARWLDLLIRTYRKTNPERKIKAYLVMEQEDFAKYQTDELSEYLWIPVNESLNMEINDQGKVRSVLRLKTSLILWELILNPGGKFLWVDADSIVLKDIGPLLDKLEEYDFLCTSRPWKPVDQQKLAAGVMGFRSSPDIIKFIARSSIDVWGHWEGWYSEQLHIYRNLTPEIRHYSFTEEEHSLKNSRDTIIMSHHANKYERLKELCEEIRA